VRTTRPWASSPGTNTAAVTVWNYDAQRGWLNSKRYGDGTGPDYEHTPSGKVRKRTWARELSPGSGARVETRYGYSAAGDLESVTYNDSSTPNLKYAYNRLGQVLAVMQDSPGNPQLTSTTRLSYNPSGQALSESYSNGPLSGLVLTHEYDPYLRRTNSTLSSPGSVLNAVAYSYDSGARLKTVSQAATHSAQPAKASYSYEPKAALVQQIEFKDGQAARLLYTRTQDAEGRPRSVTASPAASPAMTYEYAYDEADQAARVTLADCSYWSYGYDAAGQLLHGRKYASDQKPVAGQQFEYGFDHAGKRTKEDSGQGSRTNSTGASVALAQPPEYYDADGNLTNDGHWTFTWDAENRLVRLVANKRGAQLEFAYDWKSRRIQKAVSAWNAVQGQYQPGSRISFVYDDWNLIAILDSERAVLTSFAWGLELNPGAGAPGGGAGGLLIIREQAALPSAALAATRQAGETNSGTFQPRVYFAAFDGNGNLVGLVNARDGTTAAHYDYGPFGEALPVASPSLPNAAFRFSTRYQDEETGLLYCGYRYYNPRAGKWLSREPLHEYAFWKARNDAFELPAAPGDWSLFGTGDHVYVRNAPVGNIDWLGLASSCDQAVQKALRSRGSKRLLSKIAKAGFLPPKIAGADAETYCSFPGYLGDYDCPNHQGKICCLNVNGSAEVERTVRHELVHALDCCRNGLETCHDHICSEVVAYYTADCERFVNRMECALGQMRDSMTGDRACAAASAAMSERSGWNCLQEWKQREGGF
jgi:RHS repeat-associated protein